MSYPTVTHVAHDSYPEYNDYPPPGGGYPGAAPPPPPRPGFEQGYGPGSAPGPGYQGYFSDNYPPPQVAHVHHSSPNYPFHQQQPYGRSYDYSYDSWFPSPLRACLAALCCCCCLEQCCNPL